VPENVVEDFNLLIGEPVGIGDKQIGHAPKRIDAFVFRSALDRFFELDNKRSRHGSAPSLQTAGVEPPA
jgi:hypothetical protein